MICFSELINAHIKDSSGSPVGVLKDIIACATAPYPTIAAIVLGRKKERRVISITSLESWGRHAVTLNTLERNLPVYSPAPSDIYVGKNLLDQQIVDIKGIRVVRVNDLQFSKVKDAFQLVGIDVGIKGLMRRLGISGLDFGNKVPSKYIDVRDVKFINGKAKHLQLATPSSDMVTLHPADLANIIEELHMQHGLRIVQALDDTTAAKVLEEIEAPHLQRTIIERLGEEKGIEVLEEMSVHELADFLQSLNRMEREELLARLPEHRAHEVQKLLAYAADTAGAVMSVEFIVVLDSLTIAEVILELQKLEKKLRSVLFVYVVDAKGAMRGVVSLRRIVCARDQGKNIMSLAKQKVRMVYAETPIKEVARVMTRYNMLIVAVLDHKKRMVGIVKADDIMRMLIPDA